MQISLSDLKDENFYLKLNNEFVREVLMYTSEVIPYKNKLLAKILNVKFNEELKQSICIRGWYYGKRCIPMNKLKLIINNKDISGWQNVEKNLIGLKSFGLGFTKFIKPLFPIEDNFNLGLIIGHILGDGWIDSKLWQPAYCNSNRELLREFAGSMNCIFGVEPRIWVQKRKRFEEKSEWMGRINQIDDMKNGLVGTLFYPKSVSIILFSIFGKFVDNRKKKVPYISSKLSDDFKIGLIRAIFDDECSVDIKSQHIRLYQDNPKILSNIKKLLSCLKIKSMPLRKYVKRNKNRYYFGIYGYENFIKFRDKIGFTSSEKRFKLNTLIKHLER